MLSSLATLDLVVVPLVNLDPILLQSSSEHLRETCVPNRISFVLTLKDCTLNFREARLD